MNTNFDRLRDTEESRKIWDFKFILDFKVTFYHIRFSQDIWFLCLDLKFFLRFIFESI